MFFDPATKLQPTDEQLRADWDAASKLLRRYSPDPNLENTSARRWLRRCVQDANGIWTPLLTKMASVLKMKLKSELATYDEQETFTSMPSQAQVCLRELFLRLVSRESAQPEASIA